MTISVPFTWVQPATEPSSKEVTNLIRQGGRLFLQERKLSGVCRALGILTDLNLPNVSIQFLTISSFPHQCLIFNLRGPDVALNSTYVGIQRPAVFDY